MFRYTAKMTTPDDDTDQDLVFEAGPEVLVDKRALNGLETALARLPLMLCEITRRELDDKKKPFDDGSVRQLVVYEAEVTNVETGKNYGRHRFEFPDQTEMAREYLRGMLEGAFDGAGFKGKYKRMNRGRGRR